MNYFTVEEIQYLRFMLDNASPFRINRAESVICPNVSHHELKRKLEEYGND